MELTERIGRKTGGLAASPLVADVRGEREPAAYLMVSGKAMAGKAGDLFELFRDILLTARLDDRERFKQARRSTALGNYCEALASRQGGRLKGCVGLCRAQHAQVVASVASKRCMWAACG